MELREEKHLERFKARVSFTEDEYRQLYDAYFNKMSQELEGVTEFDMLKMFKIWADYNHLGKK